MIRWFDNLILALHQWVVDSVQRQPSWCAVQVVHLSSLAMVFQLLVQFGWWALLVKPMVQLIQYGFAMSPGTQGGHLRTLVWIVFAPIAFLNLNLGNAYGAAGFVECLCFISMWYFKSCRPPKPPVRKPKLAMQP